MPNTIVVGTQWGDEGKAKIIDYLTERSDIIVRFQGGANAGHTVIVDSKKFVFHLVPSGVMYPGKICVIGNGVVFDAEQFFAEVDELEQKAISVRGRLFVSDLAHLVLPYHRAQDNASESIMGGKKIGTTGRGIGPAYADKASRIGIRVGELRDWDTFTDHLSSVCEEKKRLIECLYNGRLDIDLEEVTEKYRKVRERLLPFIADTSQLLADARLSRKSILFEGAQGTFLDIDHGTYPFVTSSNTVSGAACVGSGIGPTAIDHVIGIVKTYTTRVGNGPFPTELNDDLGEQIRRVGQEFGATTGRPRRCGWIDTVLLRKSVELNGLTRFALTKLDVLDGLDEIKICTKYLIDGKETDRFPSDPSMLKKAVPVYETVPGWKASTCECQSFDELPQNARKYIQRIQHLCHNVSILVISTGPDRKQTFEVEPLN